jgi:hypothetical protein
VKLADLRKLAIRDQIKIRFRLSNGLECVVTEHGVAQVPGLSGVPDFNLEQELASVADFSLEPVVGRKSQAGVRRLDRAGLSAIAAPSPAVPEREEE